MEQPTLWPWLALWPLPPFHSLPLLSPQFASLLLPAGVLGDPPPLWLPLSFLLPPFPLGLPLPLPRRPPLPVPLWLPLPVPLCLLLTVPLRLPLPFLQGLPFALPLRLQLPSPLRRGRHAGHLVKRWFLDWSSPLARHQQAGASVPPKR